MQWCRILIVGVSPRLVETSQEQWRAITTSEVVRLTLSAFAVIPLVKTIDGDNAGSMGERRPERRLFGDGFGASIKEASGERLIFRPRLLISRANAARKI